MHLNIMRGSGPLWKLFSVSLLQVFKVKGDGSLDVGRIFFNLTDRRDLTSGGHPGLFDGLSVDNNGNLWSSMPGGMLVINQNGDALGKFETRTKTANVVFGDDQKVYIAAHQHIIEVQTKVSGALPLRRLKEHLWGSLSSRNLCLVFCISRDNSGER